MEDKKTRILETAIGLAEKGGFEAVRLRDVAAQADVALGTLYKRFSSKEQILVAALGLEADKLERLLVHKPAVGDTEIDRVLYFFETATKHLFRKPNLARAVLRALTSGDSDLTAQVALFHQQVTNMIVASMRGVAPGSVDPEATNQEMIVAFILQQVWFASLVGWMGGLIAKPLIIDQLRITLALLLRGLEKEST